jgi:hypothetical protein
VHYLEYKYNYFCLIDFYDFDLQHQGKSTLLIKLDGGWSIEAQNMLINEIRLFKKNGIKWSNLTCDGVEIVKETDTNEDIKKINFYKKRLVHTYLKSAGDIVDKIIKRMDMLI